jgi:mono/diheme cytochrome c family protein
MARLSAALAMAVAGMLAAEAQAAGDPLRGREVAEKLCGRCHAWDPERPWNSIGSTPSFMWMARRLDFWRERVLSVTDRRPHIAQKFEVTAQDLEDVLAYIETLKPREENGDRIPRD